MSDQRRSPRRRQSRSRPVDAARFLLAAASLPAFCLASAWPASAVEHDDPIVLPQIVAVPASAPGHADNAAAFLAIPIDLPAVGYAEQEYLISGNARIYDYDQPNNPLDGDVDTIRINPYVDRILVRRPSDPAKFSGNVIVEVINGALSTDAVTGWTQAHARFIANGDAWIGITPTPLAVASLKRYQPVRYASVTFASNASPRGVLNCPIGVDQSQEFGIIFDVLSQVGALARSGSPASPLYGYAVRAVFGTGYSLGGEILSSYINAVEPTLATSPYDGWMVSAGAFSQPLNSCSPFTEYVDRSFVPHSHKAAVMQTQTLSETRAFALFTGLPIPDFPAGLDSDAAGQRYRYYEIAGTAHVDQTLADGLPNDTDLVSLIGTTIPPFVSACNLPAPLSAFPDRYVYDALWANLEAWVRDGSAPPHAGRFLGPDLLGNQLGGLRSLAVDVPVATYSPGGVPILVTIADSELTCALLGTSVPLPAATLRALYPTHARYVAAVAADAGRLVSQRFMTLPDANAAMSAAAASTSP